MLWIQMMLTMTVHPTAVEDIVASTVSATCRDRFGRVDVDSFRQRACTLCFVYLFPGVGDLQPSSDNYTHLVRLNGSTEEERYVVDSTDLASLDPVCRQFAGDMGGFDGCSRWMKCCTKADECCRRQRRISGSPSAAISSTMCSATWDGFSCWGRTPAGSVVHQQCPEYMLRTDVNGSWLCRY